jgi:hypothetical protein
MGTDGHFSEGNVTGREVDRSPPSNAEMKNMWSYTFTSKYSSWRGVN